MDNETDDKTVNETSYEKKHVLDVYEIIAEHFDKTRHYIWPKVKTFMEKFQEKSIILDIGCGNGKNMIPEKTYNKTLKIIENKEPFGVVYDNELIEIAKWSDHFENNEIIAKAEVVLG